MPNQDPQKRAEANARWRGKNAPKLRVIQRAYRAGVKAQALAMYGPDGEPRCSWPGCFVADPDMLTLDHVNNDGHQHRRVTGGATGWLLYMRVIREYTPGFQTLCANHNLKKEILRKRSNYL